MPKEGGLRRLNLYPFTTGLDAWGDTNMSTKKRAKFMITPEDWKRGVATCALQPARREEYLEDVSCFHIKACIQWGATITVLSAVTGEAHRDRSTEVTASTKLKKEGEECRESIENSPKDSLSLHFIPTPDILLLFLTLIV